MRYVSFFVQVRLGARLLETNEHVLLGLKPDTAGTELGRFVLHSWISRKYGAPNTEDCVVFTRGSARSSAASSARPPCWASYTCSRRVAEALVRKWSTPKV